MKIVEVMGMRSSKYGGLERFMEKLVTMDSGNDYVLIYTASIVTPDYEERLRSAGVTLYYWPVAGRHCWSFAWRFLRLLLRIKPQVVHVHFDPAGYIALLFSYLCGIEKRIKTVHSGLPDTLPLKTKCLFSLMHHWATDVICVSEGIKRQLQLLFGWRTKLSVLYLGVEEKHIDVSREVIRKRYHLPEGKVLIANVAFHADVKGVDLLLRAFAEVKNYCADNKVALVQIGEFKEKTVAYKQLALDLEIAQDVYWLGLQNHVQEILSGCDIYTQPSRSEGIPLAIMEASSVALPTVAFRVGGIPEACVDGITGKLIPANDWQSLGHALAELVQDVEAREKMGQAALLHMKVHFEITNSVRQLIQCYQ